MRTFQRNAYSRPLVAGVALLALGFVAVPARASHRVQQTLAATDSDQDARGRAQLVLQSDEDGKFEITSKKLDPDSTFDVIVNGVKVGTLTTTGGGSGHTRFRTHPRGDDQLLGFDPRGGTVEVRNEAGEDILTGTVPDDTNPDEVACCLTGGNGGESEVECEDRTPDECTAEGGTVAASASCIPNPCPGASPPGEEAICCIPDQGADDTTVECEDRTPDECAAAGGTVVTATSCDPNPCTPTAPAPEIVCCVPDHSGGSDGLECEVITAQRCTDRGGTQSTATSCQPDPCHP
ncbi:MAG TPA: hypothetical protein VE911_11605 [Candidatus Nitrosopolaris sp.]|nr:hypothetical protein [Candidatus Nitrosopolaris sp.]